ncbi:GRF1-interacting factor 2-like isoform X1 [Primulina eburnea]|uniref:GRF1-interacting factor 2-like isoform X1 n=2 Tax=Primulina eburnea TaxID=1245227 RepID=UPI003C6C13B4
MKAVEMQQPGTIFPVMQPFPPTNITTEQIQKYLDENKKLILAILDNQNLGKLAECAQYQAQLQKNLMYLAAIADAQPQTSAMPPQMTPHPAMQQGAFYMPHPQAAAMAQQAGIFPTRTPFHLPQPLQDLRQQLPQPPPHPHATQAYFGATDGMNLAQTETNLGGSCSIPSSKSGPTDAHEVNKQDKPVTGAAARSEVKGSSNVAHGSSDGLEAK